MILPKINITSTAKIQRHICGMLSITYLNLESVLESDQAKENNDIAKSFCVREDTKIIIVLSEYMQHSLKSRGAALRKYKNWKNVAVVANNSEKNIMWKYLINKFTSNSLKTFSNKEDALSWLNDPILYQQTPY